MGWFDLLSADGSARSGRTGRHRFGNIVYKVEPHLASVCQEVEVEDGCVRANEGVLVEAVRGSEAKVTPQEPSVGNKAF